MITQFDVDGVTWYEVIFPDGWSLLSQSLSDLLNKRVPQETRNLILSQLN